ncbi:DUF397 domain-containing protein [Streptomyces sp. NPDC058417]|uniref:DUF397 domain-containing protein n=1 Tax=unclassified Streptomyces TaxID=2593676 RepID=UPI003669006A
MTNPDKWQKSSYSGPDDGNDCVELRATGPTLHLRESDTPGTVLVAGRKALAHLLAALQDRTL